MIVDMRTYILLIFKCLRNNSVTVVADLLEVCALEFNRRAFLRARGYYGEARGYYENARVYCRGHQDFVFLDAMDFLAEDGFIEIEDMDHENLYGRIYYSLYAKVLLTNKMNKLQQNIGFSLSELLDDSLSGDSIKVRNLWGYPSKIKIDVFVIMPFNEKFKPIYDDHIKRVCTNMSLSCKRADDIFTSQSVMKDIWNHIYNAKMVICDCTNKNPNVFYELGVAHTIGKDVILLTQSEDDIPFDIKHLRYIKYEYTPRGMSKFKKTLKHFISEIQT